MIRKRTCFAVSVFVVALSCSAYATIGQLAGKWKNVDSSTNGITTLEIQVHGNKVTIHAWGKCSPTDCDWGTVDATAYAPDVSSPLPSKAHAALGRLQDQFRRDSTDHRHGGWKQAQGRIHDPLHRQQRPIQLQCRIPLRPLSESVPVLGGARQQRPIQLQCRIPLRPLSESVPVLGGARSPTEHRLRLG